jgi:hypothetical protein
VVEKGLGDAEREQRMCLCAYVQAYVHSKEDERIREGAIPTRLCLEGLGNVSSPCMVAHAEARQE